MKFGVRKEEAPDVGGGDGLYLRGFKDGDTTVRFLEEVNDWIEFREHYTADRRSFPCTRQDDCPGCTSDDDKVKESVRKYAVNLQVVRSSNSYVAPHRIPVGIMKKMETRSERNEGTILNRDYIIMRSGKNFDTEYDVEADDKYDVNIKALRKDATDIEEVFSSMYEENAPGQQKSSRFEKDDDEVVPRSARKAKVVQEEFPSESDVADDDDDADEDLVIDEDELFDMTIPQLKALAAKAKIDVPAGAKKSVIIKLLAAEATV